MTTMPANPKEWNAPHAAGVEEGMGWPVGLQLKQHVRGRACRRDPKVLLNTAKLHCLTGWDRAAEMTKLHAQPTHGLRGRNSSQQLLEHLGQQVLGPFYSLSNVHVNFVASGTCICCVLSCIISLLSCCIHTYSFICAYVLLNCMFVHVC